MSLLSIQTSSSKTIPCAWYYFINFCCSLKQWQIPIKIQSAQLIIKKTRLSTNLTKGVKHKTQNIQIIVILIFTDFFLEAFFKLLWTAMWQMSWELNTQLPVFTMKTVHTQEKILKRQLLRSLSISTLLEKDTWKIPKVTQTIWIIEEDHHSSRRESPRLESLLSRFL